MYWVKSHSGHLYFIYSTLVVRYQRGNLLCVLCLYIKSVISWLYFRPFLNLWLANDLMTRLLVTVNSFVIILRKKMSIDGWFLYDYAFFMLRISISKTCNVSNRLWSWLYGRNFVVYLFTERKLSYGIRCFFCMFLIVVSHHSVELSRLTIESGYYWGRFDLGSLLLNKK